jgi:hypothetical protein
VCGYTSIPHYFVRFVRFQEIIPNSIPNSEATWLLSVYLLSVATVSPNPKAGGPPLVGCSQLLIQYIHRYAPRKLDSATRTSRSDDDIKRNFQEVVYEEVDWINLAQDTDEPWNFVHAILSFTFHNRRSIRDQTLVHGNMLFIYTCNIHILFIYFHIHAISLDVYVFKYCLCM